MDENEKVTPIIDKTKLIEVVDDIQSRIDKEEYESAIFLLKDLDLSIQSMIEKLKNWKKRKEEHGRDKPK